MRAAAALHSRRFATLIGYSPSDDLEFKQVRRGSLEGAGQGGAAQDVDQGVRRKMRSRACVGCGPGRVSDVDQGVCRMWTRACVRCGPGRVRRICPRRVFAVGRVLLCARLSAWYDVEQAGVVASRAT